MRDPSPFAHLYRLGAILAFGLVAFVVVKGLAAPASWNYDIDNWYRLDALEDLRQQPMVYGGIEDIAAPKRNATCRECHAQTLKDYLRTKHNKLSCEVCHGPLADHVQDGKKTAAAVIDRTTWTCENCHLEMPNRPAKLPQFQLTERFVKHREFKDGKLEAGTTCMKCHEPHNPTP